MNVQELQDRMDLQLQIENNYGPDFTDRGVPLSAEQYSALTQIFRDASAPANGLPIDGSTYTQPDSTTGLSTQDNRILAKAAEVLSPSQLDILKDTRIETNRREAVMSRYLVGGKQITIKTP